MNVRVDQQKCFHHPARPAVARCLSCGRFYCRECVTEHERRVVCASCLRHESAGSTQRAKSAHWSLVLRAAAGFLLLWLFAYALGHSLQSVPSKIHEGFSLPATAEDV